MSITIDNFFPTQYQINVDLAVQQIQSKLQNSVMRDDFVGQTKAYNLMDAIANATAITSRSQATPTVDAALEKYWLTQSPYEVTNTFDENDAFFLSQIVLPTSEAVQTFAASFNRQIDSTILSAALGTRYIGAAGTTSDVLPSGQKIAANFVESGTAVNSGLTIGKLRQASYLLDIANVPEQERTLVIHPYQKRDLLRAGEVGDFDYNEVRALVNGQINTFMGFDIIWSTLVAASGGTRACVAFHKNGIKLAIGKRATYMDIRPDLRHALTVRSVMNIGAVRTENTRVVEIDCTEV